MNTSTCHAFQLHYRNLFDPGRGFVFPCDERGLVDMDSLPERARLNYLYARAMVGKELEWPSVEPSALH